MSELVERPSHERNPAAISGGIVDLLGAGSVRAVLWHLALIVAFLLLFGVVLFGQARAEDRGVPDGAPARNPMSITGDKA